MKMVLHIDEQRKDIDMDKPIKPTMENCAEYDGYLSFHSVRELVEFLNDCKKTNKNINLMKFRSYNDVIVADVDFDYNEGRSLNAYRYRMAEYEKNMIEYNNHIKAEYARIDAEEQEFLKGLK